MKVQWTIWKRRKVCRKWLKNILFRAVVLVPHSQDKARGGAYSAVQERISVALRVAMGTEKSHEIESESKKEDQRGTRGTTLAGRKGLSSRGLVLP